jgi:hypothetical protein
MRTLENKNSQAPNSREVFVEKGQNIGGTLILVSQNHLKSGKAKSESSLYQKGRKPNERPQITAITSPK